MSSEAVMSIHEQNIPEVQAVGIVRGTNTTEVTEPHMSASGSGTGNGGKNLVFSSEWVMWMHGMHDEDYSLASYKVLWSARDLQTFIAHMDRVREDEWAANMYFFMREGVTPRWEDPRNKRGGSWSFRVNKNFCYTTWFSMCLQSMGECLFKDLAEMKNVNGLSLSPKNNTTTIRVWCAEPHHVLNLQNPIPNVDASKAMYRAN